MARVAFLTFGILRQGSDHPEVKGFMDRIDQVFEVAKTIPGHVITVDGALSNEPPHSMIFNPAIHAVHTDTLSIWADLESVFAFAYNGYHAEAFRKRFDWFVKLDYPNHAAWWVEDAHVPDWTEAYRRQHQLHKAGSTAQVFDLRHPFDSAGNVYTIDRERVKEIVAACPGLARVELE